MKKLPLIFIILFLLFSHSSYTQCSLTAYGNGQSDTITICLGDAVALSVFDTCVTAILMDNDFNDGTPGLGWGATNQAMFTNPCQPYSLDGTIYFWMGSTSTAPRNLTSIGFDVRGGGYLEFEFRYAVQGQASPCEGPELNTEGIAVQYSIDGGTVWNTIEYYAPNGDILNYIPTIVNDTLAANEQTPFTVWSSRIVPIPLAGLTSSTRFRWAQTASTSNVYDHWGMDNIRIVANPAPYPNYWWSHGAVGTTPSPVYPTSDTTYIVYATNGYDTIQNMLHVIVKGVTPTFNVAAHSCVDKSTAITYTGNAASNATYNWNFDGATILSGSGQGPYNVKWTSQGIRTISLNTNDNGCQSSTGLKPINIYTNPLAEITANHVCKGDPINLYANTVTGATYAWTGPGGFNSTLQNPIINVSTLNHSGNYNLTVTDTNGCKGIDIQQIVVTAPVQTPICFVEFDTVSSKNSINWTTNLNPNTDSVRVYRETTLNVWTHIGSAYKTAHNYVDNTSNPYAQSYSYKVAVKDTCGSESTISTYHTTITLLSTYDQGTNTYGFTWSPYHGITVSEYYLYGVTSSGVATLIGSVPGNQYMFNYINPSPIFNRYFVAFQTPSCGSKTNVLVKSNWVTSVLNSVNEPVKPQFSIYPNPAQKQIVIEIDAQHFKVEIIDVLGQVVLTEINNKLIDIQTLTTGTYIVRVNIDNNIAQQKLLLY